MTRVVVPVRYPLTEHSQATLAEAISIARERTAELTVLHVDLYQQGDDVTRAELKHAVETAFGSIGRARYVVRRGFLVEETILEEVAADDADIVIIGSKQVSRWRQMLRRVIDDPNIESYLKDKLECAVITVEHDSIE
ncbi:universal stress protein [Haloquadratum walsbyi]|jgi:Universal stress protein family.|nr:universal stress protein [Haloquadratum walsbyi]